MSNGRRAAGIAIVAIVIVVAAIVILYPHRFEVTSEGGGEVMPSGGSIGFYEGFEITAVPDEGCRIGQVLLDGNEVEFDRGTISFSVSVFDFSMHHIHVVFVPDTVEHRVTITHTSGGTVEPSGTVSVPDGGSVALAISPDDGYFLSALTVNGTTVASDVDSYTVSEITEDLEIQAVFSPIVGPTMHTVTITHTSGGTITPSGAVAVKEGGSVTLVISPSSGYRLSSLRVDGIHVASGIGTYTLSNITTDRTVHAVFSRTGGGGDPARLTSIEVTSDPDRTVYSVDDAFDPTGMEVTAHYSDGSSRVLSQDEYSYGPTGPLTEDILTITVSYGGFTDTVDIVVADPGDFTVTVTHYSGTRVVDGSVESFSKDPDLPLSGFSFDTEGIVPGISQTAILEVTNGSVVGLDAFVYIDDPSLDGTELAEQVILSVTSGGTTFSCSVADIISGSVMNLGTVDPNDTIEVTITLSFPHSEDNNDAMGQSIGFRLGVFAAEPTEASS